MTKKTLRQHALEHALALQEREIRELVPTAQADQQKLRFGITARKRLDMFVKFAEVLYGMLEDEQEK